MQIKPIFFTKNNKKLWNVTKYLPLPQFLWNVPSRTINNIYLLYIKFNKYFIDLWITFFL